MINQPEGSTSSQSSNKQQQATAKQQQLANPDAKQQQTASKQQVSPKQRQVTIADGSDGRPGPSSSNSNKSSSNKTSGNKASSNKTSSSKTSSSAPVVDGVREESSGGASDGSAAHNNNNRSSQQPPTATTTTPGSNNNKSGKDKSCCFCWCCCCSCSWCVSALSRSLQMRNRMKQKTNKMQNMNASADHFFNGSEAESPPTLEEIRDWGESFDKLMKCSAGRKVFREFLRCEYSEENILFWLACEDLKKEKNPEMIEEKARLIYEDYVSILSPKEVSLDSKVREIVNRNMVQPTTDTFDEAQFQIYTLMHRDSYPRFVSSPLYRRIAQLSPPTPPTRKTSVSIG